MHDCPDCKTFISVDHFIHPPKQHENRLIISSESGDTCGRCIAIIVNWLTGEHLVPTGNIPGWEDDK